MAAEFIRYGNSGIVAPPTIAPSPPTPEETAALLAARLDRSKWPLFARWIAKAATDVDLGIGDTAQRIAAKMGGEAFKAIYKKLMKSECGCSDRQARLNQVFPYRQAA